MRRRKKLALITVLTLTAMYTLLPFFAGSQGSLSRRKRDWYVFPRELWDSLYTIGWEVAGREEDEGKPRLSVFSASYCEPLLRQYEMAIRKRVANGQSPDAALQAFTITGELKGLDSVMRHATSINPDVNAWQPSHSGGEELLMVVVIEYEDEHNAFAVTLNAAGRCREKSISLPPWAIR